MGTVPISVIVTTKNEAANIARCLKALERFEEVWVVDSGSEDKTCDIAKAHGAHVVDYKWDGRYPKKRQWCLETLDLTFQHVFFVDADEVVPEALVDEIAALDWVADGYFVPGAYVFEGYALKHGLRNNKLALFDTRKIEFPVIDDLDIEGMGEIEGHYQPVFKAGEQGILGQLKTPLLHYAYEDDVAWEARHERYAHWEAAMNERDVWPKDPNVLREFLKRLFRRMPMRGSIAFLHSYIFKCGFLDGRAGYRFACSRARYYALIKRIGISNASRAKAQSRAGPSAEIAQK